MVSKCVHPGSLCFEVSLDLRIVEDLNLLSEYIFKSFNFGIITHQCEWLWEGDFTESKQNVNLLNATDLKVNILTKSHELFPALFIKKTKTNKQTKQSPGYLFSGGIVDCYFCVTISLYSVVRQQPFHCAHEIWRPGVWTK